MDLLTVDRFDFQPDWTLSKLLVRGVLGFFGVEDERRRNGVIVRGETSIPAGRYPLKLRQSPRFSTSYYTKDGVNLLLASAWAKLTPKVRAQYRPHDLIWIDPVPGFQYILLHWGNTDDDTEGCYVVGSQVGVVQTAKGPQTGVLASRAAYVKLYAQVVTAIRAGGQFITYLD